MNTSINDTSNKNNSNNNNHHNNNNNNLLDAERAGSAHSGRIRNFETCRKPAPPLIADLPTSSEKEKKEP